MASGSGTNAVRAWKTFTMEHVLQMVDGPIMKGSDDEFGDIQEEKKFTHT